MSAWLRSRVHDAWLAPEFPAGLQLDLEEAELVRRTLRVGGLARGTMIDVGAHRGTVTVLFAGKGWSVHAFEPDPNNRLKFRERFDGNMNVALDDRAVSEFDGNVVPFFTSPVSSGISGLIPFHESHVEATQATTVRLSTYLAEAGVDHVDFVKVDTEGFDLFVLRSFPWSDLDAPAAVLCEFEDAKTTKVGYRTNDLVEFLIDRGYTVLVSEWHPIVRYGVQHSWRRLIRWEGAEQLDERAWGNLVAFADPAAADRCFEQLPPLLQRRGAGASLDVARFATWRAARGLLARPD